MTFDTPDAALRATVETRERCESVRAMDPVLQEGSRFARECSKCCAKPFRVRLDREGTPLAFCRHCGKERPREDVYILRSSGSGGVDPAERLVLLADLERVVGLAWAPDPNLFRAYCVVILSRFPMSQILELCTAEGWGPGTGGGFTTWTLRRAVRAGRASLAWELSRVGMLATEHERWTEEAPRYGLRHAAIR